MKLTKKKSKSSNNEGGENREQGRRVIVVGVRLDAESNELLTWSLVKIAVAGDLVVAVHVSSGEDGAELDKNPAAFDSMLRVYEGFCHLKQIDLKLKLCRGSLIRKILVREAKEFGATQLILGINKNPKGIRSSEISVAKYCAKKLPHDCAVLAVNNGKIVFQRDVADCKKTKGLRWSINIALSKSLSADSDCSSISRDENDLTSLSSSPTCSDVVSKHGSSCDSIDTIDNLLNASFNKPCPICEPTNVGRNEFLSPTSKKSNSSNKSQEGREGKSSWPLLHKTTLFERKTSVNHHKGSILQWAMSLPSRYTASATALLDCKPVKSKGHSRSKSYVDRCIIVPTESDWVSSFKEVEELPKELERLLEKYSSVCRVFSYEELRLATSDFAKENLIGKGGNSFVYNGCLPDGEELAAKVLKHSKDNLKEFISEIEITTGLFHKNIISVMGFCCENSNLILVYDFLSRGSLEDSLHGDGMKKSQLTWVERFKVAVGVAEALAYLHNGGSGQSVIHRDVKSSNILLSEDFQPQLADFGLATKLSSTMPHITCKDVAGTFGYLAPEYFMYGKVNEKVDVYAYGVLLLELLSGRKPIMTGCPDGQKSLIMWAKPVLKGGNSKELVDPSLGDEYDTEQIERTLLAVSLCVKRAPQSRPQFDALVKLLHGDEEVLRWARSKVGDSQDSDDESTCVNADIQGHINVALLETDEEYLSVSSTEQSVDASVEKYLQGRWRRTLSFG